MYNLQNLEDIEKAIAEMQSGKRVAGVSYGDTRVQYANVSLADLLEMRNRIKSGIKDSHNHNVRQVIFTTSKGVR